MPARDILESANHEFQVIASLQDVPLLTQEGGAISDYSQQRLLFAILQQIIELKFILLSNGNMTTLEG